MVGTESAAHGDFLDTLQSSACTWSSEYQFDSLVYCTKQAKSSFKLLEQQVPVPAVVYLGGLSGTDDVLQQRRGAGDVVFAGGDVKSRRRALWTPGTCPWRQSAASASHVAVDHLATSVDQLRYHSVVALLDGDR